MKIQMKCSISSGSLLFTKTKLTFQRKKYNIFLEILTCVISIYAFDNPDFIIIELQHEISNNVVSATSNGSDQPAHMRSLIRAFDSCLDLL